MSLSQVIAGSLFSVLSSGFLGFPARFAGRRKRGGMNMRQFKEAHEAVSLVVTQDRQSVDEVRAAVEEVATEHGLSPEATFDLKVATTEAVANALRHASSGVGVEVSLESDPEVIQVEVLDRGRFRINDGLDPERGRGLPLMIALADEVEFSAADEGTRVRIRMRVDREPA
jgi:serine/threonine-protein kinase RsbW